MWLPEKIYEALPWAYVAIGLLFIGGVAFLDRNGYGTLVYAALGGACVAAGLMVRTARTRIRRKVNAEAPGDGTTDAV